MDDVTEEIRAALHRFGVVPSFPLTPDRVWVWDSSRDPHHIRSPLPDRLRLSAVSDVEAARLVPLAIVPVKHEQTVFIVMKEHPVWHYVLPSSEVGMSAGVERCQTALANALSVQASLRIGACEYAGVAVSLKVSPTSSTPTAYVFPLFVCEALTAPSSWSESRAVV